MQLSVSRPEAPRCTDSGDILGLLRWAISRRRGLSVILRSGRQIDIKPLQLEMTETHANLILDGGTDAYSPLPLNQISECFASR